MTVRLTPADIALLVLLCASWGFAQVAMKLGGEGISPLVQAGLRSALAVPPVLAWCWWRGVVLVRRDGSLPAGLLCGALFALEFWAIFAALERTTAARVVVLLYTGPFFATIATHFLLRDDRLTPRKLTGLLMALCGPPLIFADRLGGAQLVGDALALLAGLAWGGTIATIKTSRLTRIAPERTLLYQLLVSAFLIPLGYALGEAGIFAPSAVVWWSLAYQVLIVAVASYIAWFWMVARHPASRLAPFLFLTPAFGVVFGAIFLAEPVTPGLLGALLLICGGIVIVNRAGPRERNRA
ncbi:DMT family transporter [Falsiroseomonas sp.]|uniref:DMT family transporter n=1 Tax=Falsiroseomonas sp. TaxID=2870721 RepID=UPI0027213F73|nr:DMT family transporter [Falsiroseomonas sp.]MDO9503497.1 DMT family transporter [Falsiroseomonas sp.]